MVGVPALADKRREDRRGGLLGLEDERVLLVAPLQNEHVTARTDAADADHLESEVHEAVALQEVAPVLGHRRAVVSEDLLQGLGAAHPLEVYVGDDGWVVEDHPASIHDGRQLLEGVHPVALAGLAEDRLEVPAARDAFPALEPSRRLGGFPDVGLRDGGVPDGHEAHARVAGHPLAITADRGHRGRPVLGDAEAARLASDDHARGEPLDIPFPGPGQRFVEVVGVEDERPFGRGEQSEVAEVGVTAGLDQNVRAGRGPEVERHHGRGPAVVGERRLSHPLVADGNEVLQPLCLLAGQDRDRVAAGGGFEGGVIHARDPLAGRPAGRGPLARRDPGSSRPGGALGREIRLPRSVERGRVLVARTRRVRPSCGLCWFGHCGCPRI